MFAAVAIASLLATAAMPFAVVSDVVVAGCFSIVNTVLSALLIHSLKRNVEPVVERTANIVERRKEQIIPPPDNTLKRSDDPGELHR